MKKSALLLVAFLMFLGCQKEQRYTTSSPEIDIAKEHIQAYEDGDWETWKKQYTENSKIYHNNWDVARTSSEALNGHKLIISRLSSYKYLDEPMFFEMIIDDNGKKWVNFWAVWQGTLKANNATLKIPVHLSINYKDGKVVEEYGFWDTSKLVEAIDEIAIEGDLSSELIE